MSGKAAALAEALQQLLVKMTRSVVAQNAAVLAMDLTPRGIGTSNCTT